jgi:hypothetical protein
LSGPNFSLKDELPLPFGRAEVEIIKVDEAGLATSGVSTRSTLSCVKTLCIGRGAVQPATGEGKFYVYHRDADNSGWSALLTEIDWYNDLPSTGYASFTFYDEQGLPICIDENDVIFVMEHPGAGAAPFSLNISICNNGVQIVPTMENNVPIGGSINFTWSRFVGDKNKSVFCTQSSDNSQCGNTTFGAQGDGLGTVRFVAPRTGDFVNIPVVGFGNLTWARGPVVGMWHFDAHNLVRGQGGYTRNCNGSNNDYAIAGTTGWHGVILNRWERWCYLHY